MTTTVHIQCDQALSIYHVRYHLFLRHRYHYIILLLIIIFLSLQQPPGTLRDSCPSRTDFTIISSHDRHIPLRPLSPRFLRLVTQSDPRCILRRLSVRTPPAAAAAAAVLQPLVRRARTPFSRIAHLTQSLPPSFPSRHVHLHGMQLPSSLDPVSSPRCSSTRSRSASSILRHLPCPPHFFSRFRIEP